MEQYISEMLMLVVGAIVGWLPNRKKQKVDTKQIEVDVLEKSLQVLNKDVVKPLRDNLELLQCDYNKLANELKALKNVLGEMYNCRFVANCPIRFELQKPEAINRKGYTGQQRTNRPRDSTGRENSNTAEDDSHSGENDTDAGATGRPS